MNNEYGVLIELYPLNDIDPPRRTIAGPFPTRDEAQAHIDEARRQNLPYKSKAIVQLVPD